jgi:hypothetical protein
MIKKVFRLKIRWEQNFRKFCRSFCSYCSAYRDAGCCNIIKSVKYIQVDDWFVMTVLSESSTSWDTVGCGVWIGTLGILYDEYKFQFLIYRYSSNWRNKKEGEPPDYTSIDRGINMSSSHRWLRFCNCICRWILLWFCSSLVLVFEGSNRSTCIDNWFLQAFIAGRMIWSMEFMVCWS